MFFSGVPSNPRTSLDYMKGLFEGEIEDSSEVTTKSLSPSMLKKRMEHQQTLQSSSGQMRRYGICERIFKFPLHLVFLVVNYRGMCYLGR